MVAESNVAGNVPRKETSLLAAIGTDSPMQILQPTQRRRGRCEVKMSVNPMQNMQKAHTAPRCQATSKRTGQGCKAPAVRGFRVCRMHGARGGAPDGERNGNYRHGVSATIMRSNSLIS
jgi:hypothetical protein